MKKKKKTLLWKIETKKQPNPSYVFGTMHVRDQRAFKYKELTEQKILECDAFAAELNLEEAEHLFDAGALNLPEGQTLDSILKPKAFARIDKLFRKKIGVPLENFNNSRPLLISNIITEKIFSEDMPLALDAALYQFASQHGKITLGIENFEEQLNILEKIPLDFQIKSLNWMAKNFKRFRKQLQKMTKDYETGDIQKLYQATKKNAKGLRKVLIYDRNAIMARRIADMAAEQSLFAAIGAGHLGGEKGVLRLLKKAGFKVKPVLLKQ